MYPSRDNRRPRPQQNFRKKFDKPKRAPLPEGFSLFYIAIACPEAINSEVSALKKHMELTYGCKAAGKSPAHLTVVPPFRAEDEMLGQLKDFLTTFNIGVVPFDIQLKGYGQFAERVLYIDVARPNDALQNLERECMAEFAEKFPGIIFGMKPEFNPHVTIATRDIPEGKLAEARQHFETNAPIDSTFSANGLALYKLEGGWWNKVG